MHICCRGRLSGSPLRMGGPCPLRLWWDTRGREHSKHRGCLGAPTPRPPPGPGPGPSSRAAGSIRQAGICQVLAVGLVQILVILDECAVSPVTSTGPARGSVPGADAHSQSICSPRLLHGALALGDLGLHNPAAGAALDLPRTGSGVQVCGGAVFTPSQPERSSPTFRPGPCSQLPPAGHAQLRGCPSKRGGLTASFGVLPPQATDSSRASFSSSSKWGPTLRGPLGGSHETCPPAGILVSGSIPSNCSSGLQLRKGLLH